MASSARTSGSSCPVVRAVLRWVNPGMMTVSAAATAALDAVGEMA